MKKPPTRLVKWIGGIIGVLLFVPVYLSSADLTDYKPLKMKVDAAVSALPAKHSWQSLKPGSDAEKNYSFDLVYKSEPSMDEANADATAIATTIVQTIKQAGMNRILADTPVIVYAEHEVAPPPGGSTVKDYGHASYNVDSDKIIWQAAQAR